MHPSNLGRLNGFLHASPQALANASPNSAVGTLSKTYRDALLAADGTVTTDDLAGILAEAANKPLTGEQVIAVHEKLIATNPELAEDEALSAQLTDEDFADELADEANEIQASETNQGLGGDESDGSDDVAEGDDADDADENDGALADAADTVGDAVDRHGERNRRLLRQNLLGSRTQRRQSPAPRQPSPQRQDWRGVVVLGHCIDRLPYSFGRRSGVSIQGCARSIAAATSNTRRSS